MIPADETPVLCSSCCGRGKVECEECDSTGDCRCRCGNEHDCEACYGKGSWSCDDCGGTGAHRAAEILRERAWTCIPYGVQVFVGTLGPALDSASPSIDAEGILMVQAKRFSAEQRKGLKERGFNRYVPADLETWALSLKRPTLTSAEEKALKAERDAFLAGRRAA